MTTAPSVTVKLLRSVLHSNGCLLAESSCRGECKSRMTLEKVATESHKIMAQEKKVEMECRIRMAGREAARWSPMRKPFIRFDFE